MEFWLFVAVVGRMLLGWSLFLGGLAFLYRVWRKRAGSYEWFAVACCLSLAFLQSGSVKMLLMVGLTPGWPYSAALCYIFVFSFIGFWYLVRGHKFILVKCEPATATV